MKNDKETPKKQQNSIGREIWEYVRIVIVVVVVVTLVNQFLLINAVIPSGSMENTIMEGDRIFGNRLAYLNSDPERFDIVIFKYPDDETKTYIKRVIGLPGETVEIRDGKVYINGSSEPLDDSFCPETPDGKGDGVYQVPEDCYFMMGDNRNNSDDSRDDRIGCIDEDYVLGKVFFSIFPFDTFGPME